MVNRPEGHAAMKRDINRLERWTIKNLTKFNKGKCKVRSLGRETCDSTYHNIVGAIQLESCFAELQNLFFLKKIHRYGDEDALDSLKGSVTGQDHYKDTVIGISRKKNQLIYKTSMKTSHSSFPHKTKLSIGGYKKEKNIILK